MADVQGNPKPPAEDELRLYVRAKRVFDEYPKIPIVRFETVWPSSTPDRPQRKRLVVQPRSRGFLIGARHAAPQRLGPGQYKVADLFITEETPVGATTAAANAQVAVCCFVEDLPFIVGVVLPDMLLMADETSAAGAITSLTLRTSEKIAGAVRFEMSLRCVDPVKLMRVIGSPHAERELEADRKRKKLIDVRRVAVEKERPSWWELHKWVGRMVAGSTVEQAEFIIKNPDPFTMEDLYPRINLELAQVVRAAVGECSIKDLYGTVAVRERIQQEIQREMGQTLSAYGLEVDRISTFQFFAPDYEKKVLNERGEVAIQAERLETLDQRVALDDQYRLIGDDQHKKEQASRAARDVDTLNANADVQAVADAHRNDKLVRDLEQGSIKKDWNRDQTQKDERLKIQVVEERAAAALRASEAKALAAARVASEQQRLRLEARRAEDEARERAKDAEHRRRLEAVKSIAELPPDQQFLYAMMMNPDLQRAFVALQQANAGQDRLAMAQQFQDKIAAVYGDNTKLVHGLLTEAAKQLGAVMSAHAGGRPPEEQAGSVVLRLDTKNPPNPS
jgi:hypothetical protein